MGSRKRSFSARSTTGRTGADNGRSTLGYTGLNCGRSMRVGLDDSAPVPLWRLVGLPLFVKSVSCNLSNLAKTLLVEHYSLEHLQIAEYQLRHHCVLKLGHKIVRYSRRIHQNADLTIRLAFRRVRRQPI